MVKQVYSEPELLFYQGILSLTLPHIRIHMTDWNNKIQRKLINYVSQHSNKNSERCVFIIGQLNVQGAELYTPADLTIR